MSVKLSMNLREGKVVIYQCLKCSTLFYPMQKRAVNFCRDCISKKIDKLYKIRCDECEACYFEDIVNNVCCICNSSKIKSEELIL